MRLPRVRFTVRRMMIAVAIAGALLGLLAYARGLQDRSADYQRLATEHQFQSFLLTGYMVTNGTNNETSRKFDSELRSHHDRIRFKYERAARYPWLPVDPDPPEPVYPRRPQSGRSPFDLEDRFVAP